MTVSSVRHVLVIGAGIGGLSAAMELASTGHAVTVVDAHEKPGGKMRQIRIGEHAIDSGPTVFTMRWIFEDLFRSAGLRLEDHLSLHQSPLLARHAWLDGTSLDLFADIDRSVEAIENFAGRSDADNYRTFATTSARIFDTLNAPFMSASRPGPLKLSARVGPFGIIDLIRTKPFTSLWAELGRQFVDPRLRQLFARYATYCGSSPFQAPATLMLIAHAERLGVWMVEGGMQQLATVMAERIVDAGGTLRQGSVVEHIETDGNRVTGARLENGEIVKADAVVFNGDSGALAEGLLGKALTTATKAPAPNAKSLSAITISAVADIGDYPLAHHTVLFGDHYQDEFAQIFSKGDLCKSPTIYICAQSRGTTNMRAAPGPEPLFCLMNAPARRMNETEIEQGQSILLENLARHGIHLKLDNANHVRTTPNDFAQLFPATSGALYGRPTHGWVGSFQRPGAPTKVAGLYLAGGSVHPGAGVPMTAMSGRLAAKAVQDYLR